ncbi:MAG: tetratricopeptide repeat protein [Polyangia bacterium]
MPDRSPRSPRVPGQSSGQGQGPGLGREAASALGAHLQRAGESLRAGQLEDAQTEVEAALRLAPDDVRAQNLLGLLHFRTSRLDEARALYQRLLVLHPGDVALRLNLGLVELRRADYPAAINHLGRVAEVEPDNVRALGYYGLALFRAGELTRALPVLQRAGQSDLVRQIEDRLRRAAPAPASSPAGDSDEMTPVRLIASEDETPTPAPPRVAEPLPPSADSPTEIGTRTPLSLGAFLRARALGLRPSPSPFELTREGLLVVRVEAAASLEGAVRLCTLGTLASSGTLRFQALPRTDGALPTERSFGDGDDALQLALGSGVIVLGPGAGRFTLLSLRGETLRLRQAHLFGFSASLRYECSILPLAPSSSDSGDGAGQPPPAPEERALITLRGEGELVVRSLSTPAALRVLPGQRCFVELARLVGWTGSLRPLAHPPLLPGSAPYVECRGNGYVLLDPGPAGPQALESAPG